MFLKLKKLLVQILKNPFLSGSIVMIVGSNFYNFGQFAYHFLAGRFLGKVTYGDLAAIISILGVVAVVHSALNLAVIKYIASEKDEKKASNFIKWIYSWSLWLSFFVTILVILISPILSRFLNLTEPSAIYFLGPILFFTIIVATGRSVLQGLMKFNQYVVSLLTETIIKIPFSLFLVVAGFTVFGALGGMLLGLAVSFLIVRSSLSKYLSGQKGKKPEIIPLLKYSSATLVQGAALTSMYSTDLILVKHFFPSDIAGIYASLAVLGRIVFFGASPITQVMFPMIAKRNASGEKYLFIFYLSLLLISAFAGLVTLVFFLFPDLVIGALYGPGFLGGGGMLGWFGIFMSLLALAMLFTQYYLSIGQTKIVWLFALAAILQLLLIWFIHPNLLTVIYLSVTITALLVLALFIYFLYYQLYGKNKSR